MGENPLIEPSMRFTSTYSGMIIAQSIFRYAMSETAETKPTPPDDSRPLEVYEIIQDGDLHWNARIKHWMAVTPQGVERVKPGQHGFYYRKNGHL